MTARDELQQWVEGGSWADQGYESELIPVDLARRVLADLDSGRDELEATRGYAGEMARKAEAAQFDIEDADQRRDDWKSRWQEAVRHADEAFAERDAAQAILAEVRAEHQPKTEPCCDCSKLCDVCAKECASCEQQSPCDTIHILDRSTP